MRSPPRDSSVYRFGRYELAAADAELRRDGAVVPLAPKPAQLLLLLMRNRDRVVPREEILAALWPGLRVSDAAFHSVVRDLRRAVGDTGRSRALIATARGRGLRFRGAVQLRAGDLDLHTPSGETYVGREPILAALRTALDAARAGTGRVVLIGGPAGVGKTRTALELADHAQRLGAAIHYGRCWRPGYAPPFRPWVELVESIAERVGPAERAALMGPKLASLARLAPSLASVPSAADPPGDPTARFEVFDAVATWLERNARAAPLVLVLDDLEDADDSTLGLLEFVAGRIANARVLLLGACRMPALDSRHPFLATLARLARLPHFSQLTLGGFDELETRRFASALAGRALDDAEIEVLRARTDGNPLLLSLLARSLPSEEPADESDVRVPTTVRDWIRGRLLSLPTACVELLEAAATVGRVFEDVLVGDVVGDELAAVHAGLAAARRAGLLAESGPPFYRFAHALLQEAIYDDIAPARRAELHRRVGEALEARHPRDLLAAVARHLTLAVDLVGERAVEAAERAADHAERQLAFEEAVRLRDLALGALHSIRRPEALRRCDLLLGRGRALLAARRVPEAWTAARETAALAREVGSAEHLARAALLLSEHVLADSSEPAALLEEALAALGPDARELRAQVACALSLMLWYHGQSERRRALADEALATARETGDARLEVSALLAAHHAMHAPEDLGERIRLASEAVTRAAGQGNEAPLCLALSWRAVDFLEAGDDIGGQVDVDAIERIVATERAPRFRAFPERWRAMRALAAGRFAEAEQRIAAARESMLRAGDPNAEAYAGIQAGILLLEQGRGAEVARMLAAAPWVGPYREKIPSMAGAIALLELEAGSVGPARRFLDACCANACAALTEDPEPLGTASWLAEICAQLGDARCAAALADRLAPFADHTCGFYAVACRGSFARYLGLCARTAGRLDDAARWCEQAVVANRALGADLFVAWSQLEWAETLTRRGDARPRVQALFAEAEGRARELGLGRLLRAAQASPARPGIAPPRAGATP